MVRLFDQGAKAFSTMAERTNSNGHGPYSMASEVGEAAKSLGEIARHWVAEPGKLAEAQGELFRSYADLWGRSFRRFLGEDVEPVVEPEPGYEDLVCAYNLYAYISRSDVTWNPSVVSACKESLYCPTSEEFILPVIHGNDRCEWFVQLSDEIQWDIEDRDTGAKRARVIAKAGDVAAMPADIRHQGYSPKRSMLLVWENASNRIPEMIASGELSPRAVDF